MIKKFRISWKIFAVAGLFIFWAPLFMAFPAAATGYIQTNLVSDGSSSRTA